MDLFSILLKGLISAYFQLLSFVLVFLSYLVQALYGGFVLTVKLKTAIKEYSKLLTLSIMPSFIRSPKFLT